MIDQLRSEWLKLRSTRTTAALMLGLAALVVFFILVHGLTQSPDALGAEEQRNLLAVGSVSALFAAYVGAMTMTNEFRYGTIRPTLLACPVRGRVLGAKLAVAAGIGLVIGVLGEVIAFTTLRGLLAGRGVDFDLGVGVVTQLFAGTAAMACLWGAIGVALGALVRNQVGTIASLSIWVLLIEAMLIELARDVARFLPLGAGEALSGGEVGMLGPLAGGLLLVTYVVLLTAAAAVATARRDVV
jgi:ABC-type transport system involved in multi-copper enzyme maturation permease subunit